jgi:pimeloyl-ACP methyl ester carboxylesterase
MLLLASVALVLVALPALASGIVAERLSQTQVSQRQTDCPFGLPEDEIVNQTIECWELTVPENWESPGAEEVTISYVILKSPSLSPFPDPVIYLEGGPGSSALAGLPLLQSTFADLRRYRDIIIYDQRGTAFSSPLICPTEVREQPIETPEQIPDAAQGVDSDIDALVNNAKSSTGYQTAVNCAPYFAEQGIDLSQYSTANSVQDLIALMDTLDYEAYNIYGISYGTNVALELFRTYEENGDASLPALRSGIIDGNVPPNVDTRGGQALITPENILRVFEECEAEVVCSAAFPNIRQRAVDLIRQTTESPLTIGDETIEAGDLRQVLGSALTFKTDEKNSGLVVGIGAAYLPLMVDELENGISDTYIGLRDGKLPATPAVVETSPANPLSVVATETTSLAAEARALADEIEALNRQSRRAAEALASGQPLPDFFMSELRLGISKLDYLSMLFLPAGVELALTGERTRETLLGIAGGISEELAAIVPLMTDDDVTQTFDQIEAIVPTLTATDTITNIVITCNDRYGSFDLERIFEDYRAYEVPELINKIDVAVNNKTECEGWGLTPEDTDLTEAVISDLPILVSSGSVDTETPVEWGEAAAIGLSNALSVTFAYAPHGASTQFDCGPAVATAFIMYPEQQPDVTCATSLQDRFPFILPDQG